MKARVRVAGISYTDEGGRFARLVRGQVVEVEGSLKRVVEGNPYAFEILDTAAEKPARTTQASQPRTTQARRSRKLKPKGE